MTISTSIEQPAPSGTGSVTGDGCSIDVELVTLNALLPVLTNGNGGGVYTIEVPNNTALCGAAQGWQWLWLDLANPSCPFVLTEGLTTTFGS